MLNKVIVTFMSVLVSQTSSYILLYPPIMLPPIAEDHHQIPMEGRSIKVTEPSILHNSIQNNNKHIQTEYSYMQNIPHNYNSLASSNKQKYDNSLFDNSRRLRSYYSGTDRIISYNKPVYSPEYVVRLNNGLIAIIRMKPVASETN